jgi:hypothetical protein
MQPEGRRNTAPPPVALVMFYPFIDAVPPALLFDEFHAPVLRPPLWSVV